MPATPRILLIAPEASSDVAAALLAERLMARHRVELAAAGRSALRAIGARMVQDTSPLGQVGLAAVLLSIPRWWRTGWQIVRFVKAERPNAIVLFACRRFHLSVLGALGKLAPPVAWIYPPGDWIQTDDRDEKVLQAADLFVCAFEWQARRLEAQGARVIRVPHHSMLPVSAESAPPEAVRLLRPGSSAGPVVAVLPGSRPDEVSRLMPILAKALRTLSTERPGLHAVISQAPGVPQSSLASHLAGLPCTHVVSQLPVRTIAGEADVAVVCCGTATTEVAIADCPQVVVYRPAWVTAKFMRHRGRQQGLHFLSMLNLGLNQRVAPELLHTDCRPNRIATEVAALLDNPEAVSRMRTLYADFRAAMGHGSWDEAADVIVGLSQEPSP